MLLSMDLSSATWSPHEHPHPHPHPHPHQSQGDLNSLSGDHQILQPGFLNVRPGGSTMVQSGPQDQEGERQRHGSYDFSHHSHPPMAYQEQPPQPEHQQDAPFYPPKISLKHVSMALRVTSEWNRRLVQGVNKLRQWGKDRTQQGQHDYQHQLPLHHHQQYKEQDSLLHHVSQPYGDLPVNVHPSRAWQPPIQERPLSEILEEELTIFHAKVPREADANPLTPASSNDGSNVEIGRRRGPRGAGHWGPDLLPYLEHIVDLLDLHDGVVEIPLAMIYMDRACSVETPRSNGVPACPFCTPRTVHRLSLVALLMAIQAVHGEERVIEAYDRLSSLGIPQQQLQQMVEWMRAALGDAGLVVTVPQMREWSRSWEAIFSCSDHQQLDSHPQQQQQQHQRPLQPLERQQRDNQMELEEDVPPQMESYQHREQHNGMPSFVGQHHSYY